MREGVCMTSEHALKWLRVGEFPLAIGGAADMGNDQVAAGCVATEELHHRAFGCGCGFAQQHGIYTLIVGDAPTVRVPSLLGTAHRERIPIECQTNGIRR
jgi:hypothetical protein